MALFLFGISIPTRALPGIGASILIDSVAKSKAKLLARFVILESLIPLAGFNVY